MIELHQDLRNEGDFGEPTNRPPLSIHRKLNLHAKRLATLKKCSIEEALAHIIDNRIKSIGCELNGPTSEATHIYHPHTHLHTAFLTLISQWRQAIEIGNHNADHGAHVSKSS